VFALEKLLSLVRFLLLRGTTESGALKANALPGGARRLAVRAVKAAWFSRSSKRSVRALTEEAGGPGAGFSQEGLEEVFRSRESEECAANLVFNERNTA
jgi:hypothetical protein